MSDTMTRVARCADATERFVTLAREDCVALMALWAAASAAPDWLDSYDDGPGGAAAKKRLEDALERLSPNVTFDVTSLVPEDKNGPD